MRSPAAAALRQASAKCSGIASCGASAGYGAPVISSTVYETPALPYVPFSRYRSTDRRAPENGRRSETARAWSSRHTCHAAYRYGYSSTARRRALFSVFSTIHSPFLKQNASVQNPAPARLYFLRSAKKRRRSAPHSSPSRPLYSAGRKARGRRITETAVPHAPMTSSSAP